ncbi:acyltransferase family protein, partial [Vibrio breoganii]
MQKKFIKAINWFRAIAIISVVFTHVEKNTLPSGIVGETIYSILFNGTFYFIFISGYLFYHLKDRFEYKKYLKTKIRNVLSPYIIQYVLVLLLITLFNLYVFSSNWVVNWTDLTSRNGFIWHIIVGGAINGPLWFIPMITIFFIVSPLIIRLGKSRYFNIFVVLSLFVSFVTFRPNEYIYPLYMFIHFFGIYLLGIWA